MEEKDPKHDDMPQQLDIREVLLDAGYRQNRRFGLRLPSYVRLDSEGKRIRGDNSSSRKTGSAASDRPGKRNTTPCRSSRNTRSFSRNTTRA